MNGAGAILPFVLIALVFWLLILRPQRRRAQQLKDTQAALAVGTEVMLGSGIYGTVANLDDEDHDHGRAGARHDREGGAGRPSYASSSRRPEDDAAPDGPLDDREDLDDSDRRWHGRTVPERPTSARERSDRPTGGSAEERVVVASKTAHPGRRLIIFALVVVALYAAVALGDSDPGKKGYQFGGVWKPKLGLDLQGGTRITLEASTANGQDVTPANLEEARGIIDQRVNGSGVAESEVGTQGKDNIVVEIPGPTRGDLVDTVKQTAQLRFRLVAAMAPGQPQPTKQASPSASPTGQPSGHPVARRRPVPRRAAQPSCQAVGRTEVLGSASPKGRARLRRSGGGRREAEGEPSRPAPSHRSSSQSRARPAARPRCRSHPARPRRAGAAGAPDHQAGRADRPAAEVAGQPRPGVAAEVRAVHLPQEGRRPAKPVNDDKTKPLITCDEDGNKYLLSTPLIEGTQLKSAQATPPNQQNVQWTVNLTFNSDARKIFAKVTQQIANQTSPLTGQQKQFAIVLDGKVISAPTVNGVIPNGQAEISGNFTQESAQSLANSLKYGALPLTFEVPVVTEEGPTLAADQLSAGLIAGAIGLGLVLLYCLLYYRGLGIVVLFSLAIAGVITYAVVLAMSQAVNFTLTLPGIAGLIVAVGITADSFIVYFERIRDEMRSGKSMRVAVEAGWVRARATCLAADAVSLLAAVVLYIFSIGVVKGFAFALGISTVIDLVVFFLFTKPMVSWLATFKFFDSGSQVVRACPRSTSACLAATTTTRPATAGGNA